MVWHGNQMLNDGRTGTRLTRRAAEQPMCAGAALHRLAQGHSTWTMQHVLLPSPAQNIC